MGVSKIGGPIWGPYMRDASILNPYYVPLMIETHKIGYMLSVNILVNPKACISYEEVNMGHNRSLVYNPMSIRSMALLSVMITVSYGPFSLASRTRSSWLRHLRKVLN